MQPIRVGRAVLSSRKALLWLGKLPRHVTSRGFPLHGATTLNRCNEFKRTLFLQIRHEPVIVRVRKTRGLHVQYDVIWRNSQTNN